MWIVYDIWIVCDMWIVMRHVDRLLALIELRVTERNDLICPFPGYFPL